MSTVPHPPPALPRSMKNQNQCNNGQATHDHHVQHPVVSSADHRHKTKLSWCWLWNLHALVELHFEVPAPVDLTWRGWIPVAVHTPDWFTTITTTNQICQSRQQNHRPTPKFTMTLPCEPEFKTRWKIIITIKSFIHWKKYCLKLITEGEEDLTNRLAFFLSRLLRAASRFWASRLSACTVHIESMTPAWISLQVPKKEKKKEIASRLPSVESMQTSSFQLASPTNIVLWTTVTVSSRLCILQALIPAAKSKAHLARWNDLRISTQADVVCVLCSCSRTCRACDSILPCHDQQQLLQLHDQPWKLQYLLILDSCLPYSS